MAPFDRWLQRMNAVGCAGFVAMLLVQLPGWLPGSHSPHEAFAVLRDGRLWASFKVNAASRDSDEAYRSPGAYGGPVATQWAERTPVNRLTLTPAAGEEAVWPSEEDARLVASRARYEASFREFRRRMSSPSVGAGKSLPGEVIVPFSPTAQPQYAEASTCGAQMSEVAELTQHR
jgi:hypothetical protein